MLTQINSPGCIGRMSSSGDFLAVEAKPVFHEKSAIKVEKNFVYLNIKNPTEKCVFTPIVISAMLLTRLCGAWKSRTDDFLTSRLP